MSSLQPSHIHSSPSSQIPQTHLPFNPQSSRQCFFPTLSQRPSLTSAAAFPGEIEHSDLTALSPLDGRYWGKANELAPYLSEYGLIYYRVLIEIKRLMKLSQIPEVVEVRSFSEEARAYLHGIIDGFSKRD